MRNRRNEDLSSFDLLLDTMCNTFGGIVFIALLLIILAQAIEVNHPEDAHISPPALSSLPSSVEGITKLPEEELAKALSGLIYKMGQLRQDVSLQARKAQLLKILGADKRRMAATEVNIKVLKKKVEELSREVEVIENQKKRTFRLPRLHTIEKQPVFIALKHKKLYFISDLSHKFSGRRRYDMSDIRVRKSKNRITIEPIPGRGRVIEQGMGVGRSAGLGQALTNINPDREFISFAVFPDSFGEFNQIKDIFLEHGFDYNWLIIKDKFSIVRGKGGAGTHVQ